ncbi:MAG: pitrilysin family protein [Gemmatimonadota bacterium]
MPSKVDTLANGLTLIVHEDHSVPTVAVNIWYMVGSGDERPGRTGFAHLFEHLMFMGSQNAEYPAFDRLLEAAGANNNGSTTNDRTNYYEQGPANSLPLMLWLEADRMGWFVPTMTTEKVDLQRDVVKNERRQSYENQPYGLSWETLAQALYPKGHPYSWSVIGSMADLSAASLDDTKNFFRQYYAPNNAVLSVAGDVSAADVKTLAQQYFGEIPRGPAITRPVAPAFTLARDTMVMLEDRVQLPRLYFNWHTAKVYSADDAALDLLAYLLSGAKNSRLTEKLIYDQQIATNVVAFNDAKRLDGDFIIYATAKPGHTLPELQTSIDGEIRRIFAEGPTARELEQAKNATESSFLNRLEEVADKADQLNSYFYFVGTPDYFQQDLARYRAVTAADVQRVARQYLGGHRVVLSIVPQGKPEMAVKAVEATP